MPSLPSRQVQVYDEEGVLFPIRVLSETESLAARANFDALLKNLDEVPRAIRQPHVDHRWAYDLATRPEILDPVEDLIGSDLLVGSTLIFYKPAGQGDFVSWHQDRLYPGLRSPKLVTAWLALAPSTSENGCLRVIRGSHCQGIVEHRETPDQKNMLRQGQTIDGVDLSLAVDLVLKPGEMSLHHGDLIHGSNPNRSGTDRIGFVIRYLTPEAPPSSHAMIHARGDADCSHFDLMNGPPG